jgi:hypothetical protein
MDGSKERKRGGNRGKREEEGEGRVDVRENEERGR